MLVQFPLIKFDLISKAAAGIVIFVCITLTILFLALESIQDKEISIGGSSIVKSKYPKTYWVVLTSIIALTTVMIATLIVVLLMGQWGQALIN
jgi:hypothetical protein